jgi:signal transduction histidine kinase
VLYTIYGLGLASVALRNVVGLRYGATLLHGIVFNLVAIAFISMGVVATGGIASDFWLVYFVFLIPETLFGNRRLILATTALAVLSYVVATWPMEMSAAYFEQLFTRLFFLVIVGAIARGIGSNEVHRKQEVALLREQVAVGEERTRIAREIHDGVGHALTSVILQLEVCERLIRRDPEAAEAVIEEQKGILRHAMAEARELVFHLRPLELEAEGFAAAVRRHAQQLSERSEGMEVSLFLPEERLPLSPASELALARIIQEALTNTARHADARRVSVTVKSERGQVVCVIEDNGRGFEPEAQPAGTRTGGFGLKGMRERATALGGTLEIESAPGRGTRIRVVLPVQ